MTIVHEFPRTGDFIISLANRTRSMENVVLTGGAQLAAGTVVSAGAEADQVQAFVAGGTPVGILLDGANATENDIAVAIVARDAEVKADALIWPADITDEARATAAAALNTAGILLR